MGIFFCPLRETKRSRASMTGDAGIKLGDKPWLLKSNWQQRDILTEVMREVASQEGLEPELILRRIAEGQIVVPLNTNRPGRIVGIGMGLRSKVNASIGTSTDIVDIEAEVRKAQAAEAAGADTLMELSVGGDLDKIRREVLAAVTSSGRKRAPLPGLL